MSRITLSPERQLKELQTGTDEIISPGELLKKLKKSWESQVPLTVKLGADPSCPDLHLGHAVVLNKLRQLQEFGHRICFVIGDFTAMIGDPTGKSKTRPHLSAEEVRQNAETYKQQVFKILDPEKTELLCNSEWLNKLSPADMIRLLASRTLQQIIAREDFARRYQEQSPIHLHELIYPVMQAYDSVVLKADIELGGTDQKFNLLVGREMQRQSGQEPQCLILCPLLEGLDGVQKMSKSLNNYIGLNDQPHDIFGKVMSVSDQHMLRFFELLSRKDTAALATIRQGLGDGTLHPMQVKQDLAQEIVSHYWGSEAAAAARTHFETVFSKRSLPDELTEFQTSPGKDGMINLPELLVSVGFSDSKSAARRIMKQNGLRIDGQTVSSENISRNSGETFVLRQGKLKMIRILVR
ncbi:MAG: tyrosine--tRNA ligase [Deltaproteobacteria bacterium]|nr:tyrosine--tRNA ligase [Deltaproteobacteria bacterium]